MQHETETNPAPDQTFESLEVWQDAIELAARVYDLFRDCKDWRFRDQIQAGVILGDCLAVVQNRGNGGHVLRCSCGDHSSNRKQQQSAEKDFHGRVETADIAVAPPSSSILSHKPADEDAGGGMPCEWSCQRLVKRGQPWTTGD